MSSNSLNSLVIAKTGSSSSFWLPLWMHHKDTGMVMEYLLEEFVSDSFEDICGLTKGELNKLALFIAMVHDIGKSTAGFQYKIGMNLPERYEVLRHYLDIPDLMDMDDIRRTPHPLAGEAILRYLGCPDTVAMLIGAHHGFYPDEYQIADLSEDRKNIVGYRNYFGDTDDTRAQLESFWEDIVNDALIGAGLESVEDLPDIGLQAQMVLSALLITADWIASNTDFFPLINVDDTGFGTDYEQRTAFALDQLDLTEKWRSERSEYNDEIFEDTFGFLPSSIQKEVLDIVEKSTSPGLFILEAPMGCGKTEAALSSAELLAHKCRKKGLFFGMPTQATANGIFPRILCWAEKQSEEYFHSVILRHGSAAFNDAFQNIQKGIPEEYTDSGLVVNSWFCDSKKACLADFVVATVDQMLMMALKRKHVMLLHLGLSEKVVIIDEVHAYDAYMNQYLEQALQWLGTYHTPVILLSATLPAKRRMSLIRAYLGQKSSDEKYEMTEAYPLLTWTDSGVILQKALNYIGEHKTVSMIKGVDDIYKIIQSAVDKGGCIGIIMNTVNRAQTVAEQIRNGITDKVLLYHAQYIMPDRAVKEEELIKNIGKDSTSNTRKGYVVVGTQVLEQSLDIDFDLLITDICPVDLLLQRIGRLHRHSKLRPEGLETPYCYVITDEYENENSGSKNIYGKWLLKETLEQIPESVTLPDDISPLVQRVYGAYDESDEYKDHISKNDILIRKAKNFLLKMPKRRTIEGIADRTLDECEGEAAVRDGISSIEVLALKRFADGSICLLNGTNISADPTYDECVLIANQKLRLPNRFSYKWNIDKNIKELEEKCRRHVGSWQKKPLLSGQLVLFFDENNEADLAGCKLRYEFENGLTCIEGSDKDE